MSEWISVEDRLPDEYIDVLVYSPPTIDETHSYDFDCIEDGGWVAHDNNYEHFMAVGGYSLGGDDCSVVGPSEKAPYTHWMPLPGPPKEQDK